MATESSSLIVTGILVALALVLVVVQIVWFVKTQKKVEEQARAKEQEQKNLVLRAQQKMLLSK